VKKRKQHAVFDPVLLVLIQVTDRWLFFLKSNLRIWEKGLHENVEAEKTLKDISWDPV
jgi:hypothetical protein